MECLLHTRGDACSWIDDPRLRSGLSGRCWHTKAPLKVPCVGAAQGRGVQARLWDGSETPQLHGAIAAAAVMEPRRAARGGK